MQGRVFKRWIHVTLESSQTNNVSLLEANEEKRTLGEEWELHNCIKA